MAHKNDLTIYPFQELDSFAVNHFEIFVVFCFHVDFVEFENTFGSVLTDSAKIDVVQKVVLHPYLVKPGNKLIFKHQLPHGVHFYF